MCLKDWLCIQRWVNNPVDCNDLSGCLRFCIGWLDFWLSVGELDARLLVGWLAGFDFVFVFHNLF